MSSRRYDSMTTIFTPEGKKSLILREITSGRIRNQQY